MQKCTAAVESCKTALEARNDEVKLCRLGLAKAREHNSHLATEVENKNAQLQSPFRNPWLMIALGLATGFVISR